MSTTHSELTILQYNMRRAREGVMAPFFEDEDNCHYSVIAVQEPWINSFTPTTYHPRGDRYELVYPSEGRARVCFYVNKHMPLTSWNSYELSPDLMSIRLKCSGENENENWMWIHNIYRQSDQEDPNVTLDLLENALAEEGEHIVVGDFNSHHPQWGGLGVESDAVSGRILEIVDHYGLELLLPQGTITWQRNEQKSTIDLSWAIQGAASRLIRCEPHDKASHGSDHLPILTIIDASYADAPVKKRKKWQDMDKEKFRETVARHLPEVESIRGETLTETMIEHTLETITESIQLAIEKCVPDLRICQWSKPGFDQECKEWVRECNRLQRRYQQDRTPESYGIWRTAENRKKKLVSKRLRQNHRQKVETASQDTGGIWKLNKWVKARGVRAQGVTPAISRPDGTKADNPEEKSDLLKNSFFPIPPSADLGDIRDFRYPEPLECPEITEWELRRAILATKTGKAPGPDGIPNQILHTVVDQLIPLLLSLLNSSLTRGYHPYAWKRSVTVALRKPGKGDYSKPKAYRPVALLNTIGKIMESIMATRISWWMEEFQLLPPGHMGGRKMVSVEQAIHLLLERIHAAFKTETPVASLLMLDVSGAFDNVSHERLIHNLRKRQLPTQVVQWIRGFLKDRSTTIKLPEYTSEPMATPTGIPQGSPLSPILYLFYNADLIECTGNDPLRSTSTGWIDDVGILVRGESTEANCRTLETVYQSAARWAISHASVFAPEKFALMHFTKDDTQDIGAAMHLGEVEVKPSESIRVLGIHLDAQLSYATHLRHIEATASKRLNGLQGIAGSTWGFSLMDVRRLYTGAVIPQLTFGSSVWYTPLEQRGTKTREAKVLRVLGAIQKRAGAIIAGAFRITAGAALDIELFTMPIKQKLERNNAESLIRLWNRPVWYWMEQARPAVRKKHAWWSPFHRLQEKYWKMIQSKLPYQGVGMDWDTEIQTPFVCSPWWEAPKVHIAKSSEQAIKDHDLITLCHGYDTLDTYTDGSGNGGQIGAAAVTLPGTGVRSQGTAMGPDTLMTVYTAELQGIVLALQMVEDQPRFRKVNIFTDNQAAIISAGNPRICSGQYLLKRIVQLVDKLRERRTEVCIYWIPAHVGVDGNELADKAAKAAAHTRNYMEGITCLKSNLKRLIRGEFKKQWKTAWENAPHGRITFRLEPEPHKRVLTKFGGLRKAESSILIQCRTGKIGLKKYLYDIGRADSPYCNHCEGSNQTVRHVLVDCTGFEPLKQQIFGRKILNLISILGDPAYAKRITNFMIRTRLLGQFQAVEPEQLQEDAPSHVS